MLNEKLLEQILDRQNLQTALKRVILNKGKPGVDGMTVKEISNHLREHWPQIESKLCDGSYTPGMIRGVTIPKADGGQRQLGIPNVQDRFIQQAISQQLNLVFDSQFSAHSYGYRPNKSAHDAVQAAQRFAKAGYSWCIDLDISAFFDHVSHDILMHRVGLQVRDKRVLKLIGRYLRSKKRQGDHIERREKGTPQGGPLSPLLANIYLDPLDKELERRGLNFCRYADDVMIYTRSERSAHRVFNSLCDWIEKTLKLTVNREKSGVGRPWERKYLGFTISEDGNELQVAKGSISRYKERVRQL